MQTMTETRHLEQLWAWCRATHHRMKIIRVQPTATGIDDRFLVRITTNSGICRMECLTTNLESGATLLLDRLRNENGGRLPHD